MKRAARNRIALVRLDRSLSLSLPSSPRSSLSLVPLLFLLSWIFLSTNLQAQEVIISPNDLELGISRSIALFNGSFLPTNSQIRIGTFASGGTNSSELSAFVNSWTNQTSTTNFLNFLNTNFVSWNSFGSTNSPWPGTNSVSVANTNTPAFASNNLVGKPMYLWASTPTNDSSAQMLILRSWLPQGFPDPEALGNSLFSLLPSGTNGVTFLDPSDGESILTEYGVSVLFGQYFSDSLQFRMSGVNPLNEITSLLVQTNAKGAVSTYQIVANNGADRFFATTNTNSQDLTLTNLPVGFSIATNTYVTSNVIDGVTNTYTNTSLDAGLITAGTNASEGSYSIRLVASNSLTASVATNTLTWVLKAPTLSFTSGPSSITATLGKGMTSNFTSSGTDQTYTVTSGKLFGLTLSNSNGVGVLSGTPTSVGSNSVWIQATAGTNVGATNFTLVVNPFSLGIAGLTGVLTCTSGVAQTFTVTNSEGYTDLRGELYSVSDISAFSFVTGTNLVISTNTVPQLKGAENVSLTLTAFRDVDGTTASSSTTVPLRIVAPNPTALVGPTEFEVDVGQAFSTTILSDVGAYGKMSFSNLPPGLVVEANRNGYITGTNNSTNRPSEYTSTNPPWEFPVRVVVDSTQIYEGGGTYTNTNTIFRLRNTNPPYFASATNRQIAGVGRAVRVELSASNYPFVYTASNLPAGLQLNGNIISGTPAVDGRIKVPIEVPITASNSIRPGSTNPTDWRGGGALLIFYIAETKPTTATSLSGSSNLQVGNPASFSMLAAQQLGLRIAGYGFPPGLSIDSSTGLVTGTPTAAGTYAVTVFIQNGKGWIKKTVSLTVR